MAAQDAATRITNLPAGTAESVLAWLTSRGRDAPVHIPLATIKFAREVSLVAGRAGETCGQPAVRKAWMPLDPAGVGGSWLRSAQACCSARLHAVLRCACSDAALRSTTAQCCCRSKAATTPLWVMRTRPPGCPRPLQCFTLIDVDGSGTLEPEELQAVFKVGPAAGL